MSHKDYGNGVYHFSVIDDELAEEISEILEKYPELEVSTITPTRSAKNDYEIWAHDYCVIFKKRARL
jgi:hypothetical protein